MTENESPKLAQGSKAAALAFEAATRVYDEATKNYDEATRAYELATKAYKAARATYMATQNTPDLNSTPSQNDDYENALAAYERACIEEGNEPV